MQIIPWNKQPNEKSNGSSVTDLVVVEFNLLTPNVTDSVFGRASRDQFISRIPMGAERNSQYMKD